MRLDALCLGLFLAGGFVVPALADDPVQQTVAEDNYDRDLQQEVAALQRQVADLKKEVADLQVLEVADNKAFLAAIARLTSEVAVIESNTAPKKDPSKTVGLSGKVQQVDDKQQPQKTAPVAQSNPGGQQTQPGGQGGGRNGGGNGGGSPSSGGPSGGGPSGGSPAGRNTGNPSNPSGNPANTGTQGQNKPSVQQLEPWQQLLLALLQGIGQALQQYTQQRAQQVQQNAQKATNQLNQQYPNQATNTANRINQALTTAVHQPVTTPAKPTTPVKQTTPVKGGFVWVRLPVVTDATGTHPVFNRPLGDD